MIYINISVLVCEQIFCLHANLLISKKAGEGTKLKDNAEIWYFLRRKQVNSFKSLSIMLCSSACQAAPGDRNSSRLPSPAPGAKGGHLARATGEGTAHGGCLHNLEHMQQYQIWLWKITHQQWLITSTFHYYKLPDRDPGNA